VLLALPMLQATVCMTRSSETATSSTSVSRENGVDRDEINAAVDLDTVAGD
jgi:hypothetical protein